MAMAQKLAEKNIPVRLVVIFDATRAPPVPLNVKEVLNLGRLKATDGAFNYEIPDHIDVESIASVIVWCRQFSTLFAVASLSN